MRFSLAVAFATFALVAAAPARADLLIQVDKAAQQMTVSQDGQQMYVWPVSTGVAGYDTLNGAFTPFRMDRDHFSREWDDAPMPYSIFFTMQDHAIHGTNHNSLGRPASHGCVRLSVQHAALLWDLVQKNKMAHTTVVLTGKIPGGSGVPVAHATPSRGNERPVAGQQYQQGQYATPDQGADQYGTDQDGNQVAVLPPRQQFFGRNGWRGDDRYAPRYYQPEQPYDEERPRGFFPFGW